MLYELAVSQDVLDRPEVLWKAFIDFEMEHGSTEATRDLYDRLLQRTKHIKVWTSKAQFELSIDEVKMFSGSSRVCFAASTPAAAVLTCPRRLQGGRRLLQEGRA